MKFLGILIISSIVSCSQINNSSSEYYKDKTEFRHGVVPIQIGRSVKREAPLDAKSNSRGEKLFNIHCIKCHGKDATGNGKMAKELGLRPKNLVKLAYEVPNFKFFMYASQLEGTMPGWVNVFSRDELTDLENYIKSLAK